MRDSMQIYEYIEKQLLTMGISDRQMMQDSGLKRGIMDNMKKGSMPSADKLATIADYLGISLDELVGREQKNAPDDEIRSEIAMRVKMLSDSQAEQLLRFLESMASE